MCDLLTLIQNNVTCSAFLHLRERYTDFPERTRYYCGIIIKKNLIMKYNCRMIPLRIRFPDTFETSH